MRDARSEREELALNAAGLLVTHTKPGTVALVGRVAGEWPTSCRTSTLIAYFDQLAGLDQVAAYDEAIGGTNRIVIRPRDGDGWADHVIVHRIALQQGATTVAEWERGLDTILVRKDTDIPGQKALDGVLHRQALPREPTGAPDRVP